MKLHVENPIVIHKFKILLTLYEENLISLHITKKFPTFQGNLIVPHKTKKPLHFKQLV